MAIYQEAKIKLKNTRFNKIKSAVKNNPATILKTNKKKLSR